MKQKSKFECPTKLRCTPYALSIMGEPMVSSARQFFAGEGFANHLIIFLGWEVFFLRHLVIRLDGTYYKCMCKTGHMFPHQGRISSLISWMSWICESSSTVDDCGWGWKAKLKQYFSARHSKFQEISNRTHRTEPEKT